MFKLQNSHFQSTPGQGLKIQIQLTLQQHKGEIFLPDLKGVQFPEVPLDPGTQNSTFAVIQLGDLCILRSIKGKVVSNSK